MPLGQVDLHLHRAADCVATEVDSLNTRIARLEALVTAVGELEHLLMHRPLWPTQELALAWAKVRATYQAAIEEVL